MMRFLVIVVLLSGGYFGWQWYGERPVQTAPPVDVGELFQKVETSPSTDPASTGGKQPGAVDTAGPAAEPAARPPLQAKAEPGLPEAIVAADAAALRVGFRQLRDTGGVERDRIRDALQRAARAAKDVDARLAVLGSGNAFLHSEDGRQVLRQVLGDIQRMDREQALVKSTGLLEKCMRGPLAKADTEAFEAVNTAYQVHKGLVEQVAFNPARMAKARSYKVQPGDTLDGIAKRFRRQGIKVDGWTLCYVNRIGRPNRLQADKTIKVPVEPIWAKLEKESFLFAVYIGDTIVRLYWVGHGKEGCSTPETTFTVAEKLANPDWAAPDGKLYPFGHPENVLGRYFVKFAHESLHGFGAHGTTQPETIRTRSSLGCIRMHDADIEEFARLFPRGGKVVVAASR